MTYGRVEILLGLVKTLLLHIEYASAVVAVGVLAVGADGGLEVLVGHQRILELQVADATVDICVGDLLLLTDKHIEILDSLLVLLIQQTRNTTAVVGPRQIGT